MITILVQGPIRNNLYEEYLLQYQNYGEVVFVSYKNENTEHIESMFPKVKFIKIDYPDLTNTFMEYSPDWSNSGGQKNRFMSYIEDI